VAGREPTRRIAVRSKRPLSCTKPSISMPISATQLPFTEPAAPLVHSARPIETFPTCTEYCELKDAQGSLVPFEVQRGSQVYRVPVYECEDSCGFLFFAL
jgi:hypothetical protein